MSLYSLENKITLVKEENFKFEKQIQDLVEENIDLFFKLKFVKSEFSINNFRLDTLAYDKDNNSFVIIEYKKDKNFSVIDQGYAYLSLMLNNKADFILEYNEQSKDSLKKSEIDWSQSKVIFISPSFTTYQKEAVNFKDLPIEIFEIKKYENNTISLEQIIKTSAKESIKTITKNNANVEKVSEEVKVFTEEEHIYKSDFETREIYELLKEKILNLENNILLNPRKQFVGFKINGNTFCDVIFQNKAIKLLLNLKSGELVDKLGKARDVSNIGHWGNGAYEVKLTSSEDIDYIIELIKQSLKKNK